MIELILATLGWSLAINAVIFVGWFLAFWLAHDWMHRIHSRWFALSREMFDALHYGTMAGYKILIIVFNLAPYLALRIATSG